MHQYFLSANETEISSEFLKNGFVIFKVEDFDSLDFIKNETLKVVCEFLKINPLDQSVDFFEFPQKYINENNINALRLFIYSKLNSCPWFRPTYFSLVRNMLFTLIGNELAMQNKINYSIHLPNDPSSLVDIHADVFGGESPFQLNQWTPLSNAYGSNSMFILPRWKSSNINNELVTIKGGGLNHLFDLHKNDFVWLNVPYGSAVIFDTHCLHGSVLNLEETTRWSLNCRYKGLFTPYVSAEKNLGMFYSPITVRAATKIGIEYSEPNGFLE